MNNDNEIKDIKKEIIETRGMVIKSNNLANGLSAEVRSIAKRQVGYERQISWNSIAVYIIFSVLAFVGVKLAYDYKSSAIENSLSAMSERAEKAEKELASLKKEKGEEPKNQEKNILSLYEMIKDKKMQEAIDAWDALDHSALPPIEVKLFEDRIDAFRSDLSMQHYSTGLELMGKGKYAEAVEELKTSLRFKSDAGHTTEAKIEMANALRLQGKPREAIAILQRLSEEQMDRSLSDDVYWFLALAHEEAHQKDEARSVLKSLMRQFPDSQHYREARVKAAEIGLKLYNTAE